MSDLIDVDALPADLLRPELGELTTEVVREDLRDLDAQTPLRIAEIMNAEDRAVPAAVGEALPVISAAIEDIIERMSRGGRLIYMGSGTPGRIGILDASECPPTFDTDPDLIVGIIAGGDGAIRDAVEGAEDDLMAGAADLAAIGLRAEDSVVGISASGRTPYVAGAIQYARRVGALSISLACNPGAVISRMADHAIEVVVGPEVIAGSTRLKAGTAQKLVLNMISTITMVRLGKTFGNVMVDLQATNEKLRARALRVVMLITGRTAEEASEALTAAGGSAKAAILLLAKGLSPTEAIDLSKASTSLRIALEETP